MTTIRDVYIPTDRFEIGNQQDRVRIEVTEGGRLNFIVVDRAEFLAAVATELDVITIPRTDLPAVKENAYGVVARGIDASKHAFPPLLRAKAYAFLAMAEHLEKNPPIDEAQVDALATLLKDDAQFGLGRPDADEIARRLVKAGVRAPKEADK